MPRTMNNRAGLALHSSIVPLGLLALLMSGGCALETIAHLQEESEANKIKLLLEKEAGITAEKMKDEVSRDLRFNVAVPKDLAFTALAVLDRHNLPKSRQQGTAEMFGEGGLIPTNLQERAKREVGVTGDIANKLRQVPRVVDAAAFVSVPEDNPLRDINEAKPRPKASVFIGYLPDGEGRPPMTVEDVQELVQAALPEMRSAEVVVKMVATEKVSAGGTAGASGSPVVDPSAAFVNGCEKERVLGIEVCLGYKKKLLNSLWGAVLLAFVLSGMVLISVLRAMRYRKDLTRLTAQVAQLKK